MKTQSCRPFGPAFCTVWLCGLNGLQLDHRRAPDSDCCTVYRLLAVVARPLLCRYELCLGSILAGRGQLMAAMVHSLVQCLLRVQGQWHGMAQDLSQHFEAEYGDDDKHVLLRVGAAQLVALLDRQDT